jgi:hypothetical protein
MLDEDVFCGICGGLLFPLPFTLFKLREIKNLLAS